VEFGSFKLQTQDAVRPMQAVAAASKALAEDYAGLDPKSLIYYEAHEARHSQIVGLDQLKPAKIQTSNPLNLKTFERMLVT
jgi:hypothetical protein